MIRDGARRLGGTDGALDPRSHRKHRRHPGGETAAGSWDHTDFASHCGLAHDRGCRSSSLPLGRGAPPAKTKKKKRNRLSRCDALWPDCDIKWPGSRVFRSFLAVCSRFPSFAFY